MPRYPSLYALLTYIYTVLTASARSPRSFSVSDPDELCLTKQTLILFLSLPIHVHGVPLSLAPICDCPLPCPGAIEPCRALFPCAAAHRRPLVPKGATPTLPLPTQTKATTIPCPSIVVAVVCSPPVNRACRMWRFHSVHSVHSVHSDPFSGIRYFFWPFWQCGKLCSPLYAPL